MKWKNSEQTVNKTKGWYKNRPVSKIISELHLDWGNV